MRVVCEVVRKLRVARDCNNTYYCTFTSQNKVTLAKYKFHNLLVFIPKKLIKINIVCERVFAQTASIYCTLQLQLCTKHFYTFLTFNFNTQQPFIL